ncbi:MAG: hypothetical protein E7660_07225 [Ruminococcaceae bacterium]|nr:hypothetical protein [Oscillospiraceae bacterium]
MKKLLKNKKYLVPIILVLAALLIFSLSSDKSKKEDTGQTEVTMELMSDELEEKVRHMCEKVDGVGNVYVMLTLDTSEEYVYASDTEKSETFTRSEFVTSDGNGVELYVVCPKVRGVAVVCDGGDSAVIKKTLTELISCALGIPTSSISIAGT